MCLAGSQKKSEEKNEEGRKYMGWFFIAGFIAGFSGCLALGKWLHDKASEMHDEKTNIR